MQNIIIFEGPGKIATVSKYKSDIEKIIGGTVLFDSTGGHLLSTNNENLDIDIDIDRKSISANLKFYGDSRQKAHLKSLGEKIQECISSKGMVYIFTDSDRAGEMIAREIVTHFKLKKGQFLRKGIASMEKDDFLKYFKETQQWYNEDMANGDYSRMILDKLWGYVDSPNLWGKISREGKDRILQSKTLLDELLDKFKLENPTVLKEKRIQDFEKLVKSLSQEVAEYATDNDKFKSLFTSSIGRVQIPMLRLVGDTFVDSFKKVKLSNSLRIIDENKVYWGEEESQDSNIDEVYKAIKDSKHIEILSIANKKKKMSPPIPYKDTTLQSDGTKILGLSPTEIAEIGQKLYEQGMVTYYRSQYTGYTQGSYSALTEMVRRQGYKLVARDYPLPEGAGHDAIHVSYKGNVVLIGDLYIPDVWKNSNIDSRWLKFFDLVYRRSLSGFMEDVSYLETTVEGKVNGYSFRVILNTIENIGFAELYPYTIGNIKNIVGNDILSMYLVGNLMDIREIKLEKGKFRFSSRLSYDPFVQKLEKYSISTAATFVPIFKKITEEKKYATFDGSDKNNKYLDITAKGWIIYNIVKDYDVFDLETTERLEDELDKIETGKGDMQTILFDIFSKQFIDTGMYEFYNNWKLGKSTKKEDDKTYIEGNQCDICGGRTYIVEGISKSSGKPFKMVKCENEKSENKNGKWINSGCKGPTKRWL